MRSLFILVIVFFQTLSIGIASPSPADSVENIDLN